jgi:hypothetical protein
MIADTGHAPAFAIVRCFITIYICSSSSLRGGFDLSRVAARIGGTGPGALHADGGNETKHGTAGRRDRRHPVYELLVNGAKKGSGVVFAGPVDGGAKKGSVATPQAAARVLR